MMPECPGAPVASLMWSERGVDRKVSCSSDVVVV